MAAHDFLPADDNIDQWSTWADDQLRPLGLTVALLQAAAEAGRRRQESVSPLAPPATPGQDRWSETVVVFRERTGWETDDLDGLPKTLHPSGKFQVVVTTGRGGVGSLKAACPTPKNGLGSIVRAMIDGRPRTIPLMNRRGDPVDFDEYEAPELWFFMTDYHDGMIYAELSCPSARRGDEVVEYRQRIPLPPIAFNTAPDESVLPVETPDDEESPSAVVDVEPLE